VVFEERPSSDSGSFDLIRTNDDVTLRRMAEGLAALESLEGRQASHLGILLGHGEAKPTRPGQLTLLDEALNDDQRKAVEHGVFAEDLALIHGPPGTGKTRVLVEVVRQCLERGERVLCLTASNAAVDHLAISLLDKDPSLPLARAGHPARVHSALEAHTFAGLTDAHELRRLARRLFDEAHELLRGARRRSDRGRDAWQREREARVEAGRLFADARRLERQAVEEVARKARVLCGTLTGFARELPEDTRFDVLVVDEASQAITPALLLGLPRAGRLVLAGDHRQLPPTVLSLEASKKGLSRTAFDEWMARDEEGSVSHMLTVQHRMHASLMTFPSTRFYEERLVAHEAVASHSLEDLEVADGEGVLLLERPLDIVDTAGAGHEERHAESSESRDNPGEAALVERLVRALAEGGLSPEKIGVITPYSAQAGLLGAQLADLMEQGLEVDSVDGFQGREKEAIFFSAVRSNALSAVGFLADVRRLNVAITRARRKLIVVADSATLSTDETWSAFFDHAIQSAGYRSCFELPESP
jgi:superfamily I DNA and/or RNA helicase